MTDRAEGSSMSQQPHADELPVRVRARTKAWEASMQGTPLELDAEEAAALWASILDCEVARLKAEHALEDAEQR